MGMEDGVGGLPWGPGIGGQGPEPPGALVTVSIFQCSAGSSTIQSSPLSVCPVPPFPVGPSQWETLVGDGREDRGRG